jgi:hypothetical protein
MLKLAESRIHLLTKQKNPNGKYWIFKIMCLIYISSIQYYLLFSKFLSYFFKIEL